MTPQRRMTAARRSLTLYCSAGHPMLIFFQRNGRVSSKKPTQVRSQKFPNQSMRPYNVHTVSSCVPHDKSAWLRLNLYCLFACLYDDVQVQSLSGTTPSCCVVNSSLTPKRSIIALYCNPNQSLKPHGLLPHRVTSGPVVPFYSIQSRNTLSDVVSVNCSNTRGTCPRCVSHCPTSRRSRRRGSLSDSQMRLAAVASGDPYHGEAGATLHRVRGLSMMWRLTASANTSPPMECVKTRQLPCPCTALATAL